MEQVHLKTKEEIALMAQGGKILAQIKEALFEKVEKGVSAWEIEVLTNKMIEAAGAKASFKMVPGYAWATCVNVNEGLVHGIPKKEVVFKDGDLVSVDLGVYFQGFHTDASFSKLVGRNPEAERFLKAGQLALEKAIGQCRVGKRIFDISEAIETTLKGANYAPIKALVGHGVGRSLHEEPQIPCFVPGKKEMSLKIEAGMALAIEVMYALGKPEVVLENDGWTISMADGKIAALFEETVAIGEKGPQILTAQKNGQI